MNLQARAGDVFRPAELSLQKTIAQQVSMVAYALRQSLALQRSLEALVTTREEERLRIRRDLHDGLGPALAGITLKLDAARNHLTNRPDEAAALLLELKRQTQQAIADIRRLVYDLRPPALDQLGFEGALREQVASGPGDLDVTLRLPASLGSLPPAMEVAGYRIVQEALTNVHRHANAGVCRIEIEMGGSLTITVEDDGIGLPAEYRAGVGLRSMRERAEELGGTFWAGVSELGGTRVVASLPWSAS
jgi:signal transduction histidine kinase